MTKNPPLLKFSSLRRYICTTCLVKSVQFRLGQFRNASTKARRSAQLELLPQIPARTRFAPSPTGYLHLGSLRTALFNYLLAKRTGGQFLLRLEDTDKKRTVPDAERRLYEDLKWAGLQWDEGPEVGGSHGPYRQSERTELYQKHAHGLLRTGHGYRCFCSPERLNELAEERTRLGMATDYDRSCANISEDESNERASRGEKFVIRLKVPNVYPEFIDMVYGKVGKIGQSGRPGENTFEDPILLKSDGMPTYHLANVVDDHLMEITHVVRGTEWLPATSKHLALYSAFGWEPPTFAHVGLLVNEDGSKLSKRNLDTNVASFKKMGVLPEALANFVALLGWSHKEKSDVMSLEKLVASFKPKFTKGNTAVNLDKLWFLQGKHAMQIAGAGSSRLEALARQCLDGLDCDNLKHTRKFKENKLLYVSKILKADAKNFRSPKDFIERNEHFFTQYETVRDYHHQPAQLSFLNEIKHRLSDLTDPAWTTKNIKVAVSECFEARKIEDGPKYQPAPYWHALRDAVACGKEGAAVLDIIEILGFDETMSRLALATN